MEDLVPGVFAGLVPPWDRTDAGRRMDEARELPTTPETVGWSLDVLERCLVHAAAHPDPAGMHERVVAVPALRSIEDTWPRLLRYLSSAMPRLCEVTDEGIAGALMLAAADDVKAPDPRSMKELTRIWVRAEVPTLARQASQWLSERLPNESVSEARERYFQLLAGLVPNLGDSGNGLVTHLEMVGEMEAAAYLLCIERHPATGASARETAREYLSDLERRAHPHGRDLPPEVWAMRGGRLTGIRRLYVEEAGGPPQDQMLELTFDEGRAIQVWAGHGKTLRVEAGHYEAYAGESALMMPGADQAVRLTDDTVACLAVDTGSEPLNAAVGRRLTDASAVLCERVLNGLMLRFETVVITMDVPDDLVLEIGAEMSVGNEG